MKRVIAEKDVAGQSFRLARVEGGYRLRLETLQSRTGGPAEDGGWKWVPVDTTELSTAVRSLPKEAFASWVLTEVEAKDGHLAALEAMLRATLHPEFTTGETVKLKNGEGPSMVLLGDPKVGKVKCLWFDRHDTPFEKDFPVVALKKV